MPKSKEIAPEFLAILHARVSFIGVIACDRCGAAAHHETTLLRHDIVCHVCGYPLPLTPLRDGAGRILTSPSVIETRIHTAQLKDLEAVEGHLSRGADKFILNDGGRRR